ncbi:carbon storage regulator [Thiospirochaeta perfilievii]|uniref:Translational regulator CsrA n=1 Tax=Thiospirochaeta perfilievii TaxID=252967 RepID=A0A5C1QE11_9SPIO|nr:carbon storage regulator CsrA [Thiospirochaeta perfilievii]QEN05821.1 carbon storage regulator [Thiospirochaeta perfilievii]
MLILARKKDESIIINDNISISVIEIKGESVKIGIEAPNSVKIYRKEVYDAIQNENKAALNSNVTKLPTNLFNKD